ncbi:MAG: TonB-dependent receptor [Ignavibacteriaceae bacterium]|nr:TonB-dependent receptor [Ignavibacteriaceae bacterium]
MKKKNIRILLSLILIAAHCPFLFTQSAMGRIEGIILDGSTDKPLENAFVKIQNTTLGNVTDKNGIFEFVSLPYGKYFLEVSFVGFKTYSYEIEVNKEITQGIIIHLYPVPIETSPIIVTGSHSNSKFDDMNELINVLKGKELERELGMTLASTLKNETGLSIRSMGPAPARPVIRGLGSDRVQITEDGIQTTDLSATSPDHAVSIEPFTIERIEVIRGPKVLLQNTTTIGGVVNILRDEIPESFQQKFSLSAGIYGETVNKGYLGSVVTKIPLGKFVFRGEISHRKTQDLNTPIGILKNSDIITDNYSVGASFFEDWGLIGVSVRQFETNYGVPGGFVGAHPNGVDIKMFKRQFNFKFKHNFHSEKIEGVEIQLSRDYYRHTEYERADLIGADFSIYNYRGSVNLFNNQFLFFDRGTSGVSFEFRDFNIGGFVFTAPTKSLKLSGYSYQSFSLGRFSIDGAFRISFDKLDPRRANPSSKTEFLINRKFWTYSLSVSALYGLTENFFVGGNISKSSRVPTIEELYSEGPHLAAYSYEIGNPNLKSENGIGSEIFSYYKNDKFFFMITVFRNDLWFYIIPRNTGKINSQTLLPIYQTVGESALLTGIESHLELELLKDLSLNSTLSYTFGELKNYNSPLPQIPPLKYFAELKYFADQLTLGLSTEVSASQTRIDFFEQATAGYAVFNSFIQYSLITDFAVHNFSLNCDNILNKEYRNHLSRVKIIMPEAGRNFRFTYRVYL